MDINGISAKAFLSICRLIGIGNFTKRKRFRNYFQERGPAKMKINDDKTLIEQVLKPKIQKAGSKKDDNFKNILFEIQSESEESKDKQPLHIDKINNSIPKLQNAGTIERLNSFNLPFPNHENDKVRKVEQLIDLLESYSEALADGRKNLRQISQLVSTLERESNRLQKMEDTLPDGNALQDILKEALILTQVEVSRFNRGDYL